MSQLLTDQKLIDDLGLSGKQLQDKYARDDWGHHPSLTRKDWIQAVSSEDTISSYWDWVASELLAAAEDRDIKIPYRAPDSPRVLVTVSGGVAEIHAEGDVQTLKIDYDDLDDDEAKVMVIGSSWISLIGGGDAIKNLVATSDEEAELARACTVSVSAHGGSFSANIPAAYLPLSEELVFAAQTGQVLNAMRAGELEIAHVSFGNEDAPGHVVVDYAFEQVKVNDPLAPNLTFSLAHKPVMVKTLNAASKLHDLSQVQATKSIKP